MRASRLCLLPLHLEFMVVLRGVVDGWEKPLDRSDDRRTPSGHEGIAIFAVGRAPLNASGAPQTSLCGQLSCAVLDHGDGIFVPPGNHSLDLRRDRGSLGHDPKIKTGSAAR
ncbi:hypothetical protein [Lentzea terrae]|uniref:hypothetical protein n=1 Tax=Lentzea terrae TaxID=2200761 RepID=UPI00130057CF|nr:hypothetical protein [Lentzea terrae]